MTILVRTIIEKHDPKLLEACQRIMHADRLKRSPRGIETNFGLVASVEEMVGLYDAYRQMATDKELPSDGRALARAVVKRVERELAIVETIHRTKPFSSRLPQLDVIA